MRRRDRSSDWNPPRIEGRLVELRHHSPSNLPTVLRWYADPEVARLTRYSLQPMPREEVERFFQTRLLSTESVAYGIHLRASGRLIGLTTFSSLDPDNGSVLFHITIGESDAWGHGYGTEAARLMLWLAFERIGLHRVGLTVFAFNERAIRSYEKAGFRIEGQLREAIVRDDRYWDEIQMGILRDEWLALRADAAGADATASAR
jgi:RimJ/RimL family protein N-acetyltransferase